MVGGAAKQTRGGRAQTGSASARRPKSSLSTGASGKLGITVSVSPNSGETEVTRRWIWKSIRVQESEVLDGLVPSQVPHYFPFLSVPPQAKAPGRAKIPGKEL